MQRSLKSPVCTKKDKQKGNFCSLSFLEMTRVIYIYSQDRIQSLSPGPLIFAHYCYILAAFLSFYINGPFCCVSYTHFVVFIENEAILAVSDLYC
jgi:hypothetical protein